MITLIGFRYKHSNVLSREVLIRPFLLGNVKINCFVLFCEMNPHIQKHVFICRYYKNQNSRSGFAGIAQLAEHQICNLKVAGSSPVSRLYHLMRSSVW